MKRDLGDFDDDASSIYCRANTQNIIERYEKLIKDTGDACVMEPLIIALLTIINDNFSLFDDSFYQVNPKMIA